MIGAREWGGRERGVKVGRVRIGQEKGKSWEKLRGVRVGLERKKVLELCERKRGESGSRERGKRE